jgi:hypothetical protein
VFPPALEITRPADRRSTDFPGQIRGLRGSNENFPSHGALRHPEELPQGKPLRPLREAKPDNRFPRRVQGLPVAPPPQEKSIQIKALG